MPGIQDTLHRHWRMLNLVPGWPSSTTVADLASRLRQEGYDVSKRTVERDLQSLSTLWPLASDESEKPFRWSYAKGATVQIMPGLNAGQAAALSLAKQHLAGLLPAALQDSLDPLYAAADHVIAQLGWKRWVESTAFVPPTFALQPAAFDPSIMAVLQEAIAGRCQIDIQYRGKWDAEATARTLVPLGILVRGPVTYLVACKPQESEPRQYAMQRIASAQKLPVAGEAPANFNLQVYARSPDLSVVHKDRVSLVLWFDPPAAQHLLETPMSANQTWRHMAGVEKVEIRATLADSDPLRWWILAFGDQVEVRAPKYLRTWIALEFERAASPYKID